MHLVPSFLIPFCSDSSPVVPSNKPYGPKRMLECHRNSIFRPSAYFSFSYLGFQQQYHPSKLTNLGRPLWQKACRQIAPRIAVRLYYELGLGQRKKDRIYHHYNLRQSPEPTVGGLDARRLPKTGHSHLLDK